MTKPAVPLDGRSLTLDGLESVALGAPVALDAQALEAVAASEAFVKRVVLTAPMTLTVCA